MIVLQKKTKEHNLNWPQIPDHSHRILIVWGSRSGKTNALFNQINHEPDIRKKILYAKDPYKAKYQLLINTNGWIIFIKNIEQYNPNKKQ